VQGCHARVTFAALVRNESNMSWAHRRLPGQDVTGVWPLAHDFCNAGVPAPYRWIIADRMSRFRGVLVLADVERRRVPCDRHRRHGWECCRSSFCTLLAIS
jgi:hypothetical protein